MMVEDIVEKIMEEIVEEIVDPILRSIFGKKEREECDGFHFVGLYNRGC